MALCVLVFDINRRCEGADGIAVDGSQLVVKPLVLFCALFDLTEQTMCMNAHSDVAHALFSAIPMNGVWTNATEFTLELPNYLRDIFHELHRLHQEQELYHEDEESE